ncbi:hypothetical protein RB653_000556 [Dictyostelium firmibasis]|uniref:LNR domain-containing protein n=1 Tax=Dictyostelium firmibasis TaxID=79012 RepID=A0AAN7YW10_9MYCE
MALLRSPERGSVFKLIQFKLFSFLSSRFGMLFCIIGVFISFNTILQLVLLYTDSSLTPSNVYNQKLPILSQSYWEDNVGGKSYQNILCSQPIDVVYTWVNGSDPKLIKEVTELKRSKRDPLIPECQGKQTPEKDKCYRDDNTASRYVDNQELKYSLRSIEKFAPWVRHIFIVTNGQVPNWINLSNPKLSIVTHQQIFANKSHLPTFSSPSIETHLHRIPGLSKKFIYLNDDVMLGREIYPDDFVTQNGGQRVFLSWPVPNCNDGCPNNWIGDGFCDNACNVFNCEFDAGDCDNSTGTVKTRWWNRNGANGGNTNTGTLNSGGITSNDRLKSYCSRGCPDSWVGDKHCDRMCKNEDCGYDAGDCGVEIMFTSMKGYEINSNTSIINLPDRTRSVYFNLSSLIGDGIITDGSHDNAVLVRTATISQKYKIMTLTFHKDKEYQNIAVSITFDVTSKKQKNTSITTTTTTKTNTTTLDSTSNTNSGENDEELITESIEKNFNITLSTKEEESSSSSSSGSSNSGEMNNNVGALVGTDADSEILPSPTNSNIDKKSNLSPKNATDEVKKPPLKTNSAEDTQSLAVVRDREENTTGSENAEEQHQQQQNNSLENIVDKLNDQQIENKNIDNSNNDTQQQQKRKNQQEGEQGEQIEEQGEEQQKKQYKDKTNDKNENKEKMFDLADTLSKEELEIKWKEFYDSVKKTQEKSNLNENTHTNRGILSIEIDNSLDYNDHLQSHEIDEKEEKEEREKEKLYYNNQNYNSQNDNFKLINQNDNIVLNNNNNNYKFSVNNQNGDENEGEDENENKDENEEDLIKNILKRKEIELREYEEQLSEQMEEERKYRINKETERRISQEGEIFPWEEFTPIGDSNNDNQINSKANNRKLLDMFGDSLKFVNRLYSKEFGSSPRKVPAHMPHMIDVDVMYEMQAKWPKQWDDTSSHSLRHPQDMQYAFSFFYYLINKKQTVDIDKLWKTWDGDRDNVLNENELRTFSVNVYNVPLKPGQFDQIKNYFYHICIQHKLLNNIELGIDLDKTMERLNRNHSADFPNPNEREDCPITLDVIKSDNKTMEDIYKFYSKKSFYKTTLDGTDEVAFLMVENDHTSMQNKFDGIRTKRQKFICLNDNINHTSPNTTKVVQVLHGFYDSLFPLPSSFELPPGQFNNFQYIDDFKAEVVEIRVKNYNSYYLMISVSLIFLFILWKCKCSTSLHRSKLKKGLPTRMKPSDSSHLF